MKNRVKELRTAAGMTQQQLADRVHVSSRTIISLEKELYNPSLLLARSRTLSLLRGTLMAVLILSLIGALANPKGELVYGGMMVVSGVLYTLSLFIELACSFYYEGRI